MARRRSMHVLMLVVLYGVIGFSTSVIVAWACVLRSPTSSWQFPQQPYITNGDYIGKQAQCSGVTWASFYSQQASYLPLGDTVANVREKLRRRELISNEPPDVWSFDSQGSNNIVDSCRAGFPFKGLSGFKIRPTHFEFSFVIEYEAHEFAGNLLTADHTPDTHVSLMRTGTPNADWWTDGIPIPTGIRLWPMIGNCAFYAAIAIVLQMMARIFLAIRGTRRARSRNCRSCNYPIPNHASNCCPECGYNPRYQKIFWSLRTALVLAVSTCSVLIGLYVTLRATDSTSAIHVAAATGDIESVRAYLEHGGDPDTIDSVAHPHYRISEDLSPTQLAVINRHYEIAKIFLEHGADVPSDFYGSPEVIYCDLELIKIILDRPENATLKSMGFKAVDPYGGFGASECKVTSEEQLQNRPSDSNKQTVLQYWFYNAFAIQDYDAVQYLMNEGAACDATALHLALKSGNWDLISLFDPISNADYSKALDNAFGGSIWKSMDEDGWEKVLQHGAPLSARDSRLPLYSDRPDFGFISRYPSIRLTPIKQGRRFQSRTPLVRTVSALRFEFKDAVEEIQYVRFLKWVYAKELPELTEAYLDVADHINAGNLIVAACLIDTFAHIDAFIVESGVTQGLISNDKPESPIIFRDAQTADELDDFKWLLDTAIYHGFDPATQLADPDRGLDFDPRLFNTMTLPMLKVLESYGLDFEPAGINGIRAMHEAAKADRPDVIQYLFECGHDIDAADDNGNTPMHHAAHNRSAFAVEALLKLSAKHDLLNKEGKSPLDTTKGRYSRAVVNQLWRAGTK